MRKNYYECYSFNLMKYLQEGGEEPLRVAIHHTTKNTIWIFKVNPQLSNLLQQWSKSKIK